MSADKTNAQDAQMFRSEFSLVADLVAAEHSQELRFEGRDGYTTILRNAEKNEHGEVPGLHAVVIGPAESLGDAMEIARSVLADQLDLLAFTTHSRYRINAPVRCMDWKPHLKKIRIVWFQESDARFPPAPELLQDYLETAAAMDKGGMPAYLRTALRAFRRGLREEAAEDQFMSLWLALEVVAENMKEKKPVPISCGKCKGHLSCVACGHEPTRIPLPKEQITKFILARVGKAHGVAVAKNLFIARNGLMHGRSVEAIEKECEGSMHAITNALADIVFDVIYKITNGDTPKGKMLHRAGEFLSLRLVVRGHGSFDHDGVDPYPREGVIPNVKMRHEVQFRRRSTTDDSDLAT